MFKLSMRSKNNLVGVKNDLVDVINRAIAITSVDFGVIEGLRSIEKQKQNVKSGASQTMSSKHLTGNAVDLIAYDEKGKVTYELKYYFEIAHAVRTAARDKETAIKWGAAWTISDIRSWNEHMGLAVESYKKSCSERTPKIKPFIDAMHFELSQ